jgi:hypothetical protein
MTILNNKTKDRQSFEGIGLDRNKNTNLTCGPEVSKLKKSATISGIKNAG